MSTMTLSPSPTYRLRAPQMRLTRRGRLVVFMCTNRVAAVDPAVRRRAGRVLQFLRPDDSERRELLAQDLSGVPLTKQELEELVVATGPGGGRAYGMTYSDLRTRFLAEAVLEAFPSEALTFRVLLDAARRTVPTPPFAAAG